MKNYLQSFIESLSLRYDDMFGIDLSEIRENSRILLENNEIGNLAYGVRRALRQNINVLSRMFSSEQIKLIVNNFISTIYEFENISNIFVEAMGCTKQTIHLFLYRCWGVEHNLSFDLCEADRIYHSINVFFSLVYNQTHVDTIVEIVIKPGGLEIHLKGEVIIDEKL